MTPASHQTVKLARGKHTTPAHGTCVMELASMLAGEPFTDHPPCACPIVGAFLRSYNDWVDDRRRQDLYAYAAEVVGSRASSSVQEARAQRLMVWAEELERRPLKRIWFGSHRWTKLLGPDPADIASRVVCAIARQKDHPHQEVLAILDELLAMGRAPRTDLSTHRRTLDDYSPRWLSQALVASAIAPPSKAPASTSPG